ncbi:hypothetical protein HK096_003867, partial [Nowakowskiella sp. JEL0078]
ELQAKLTKQIDNDTSQIVLMTVDDVLYFLIDEISVTLLKRDKNSWKSLNKVQFAFDIRKM